MDRSGDFGLLTYNVKNRIIDYKVIYTDLDNNILKETDPLKFSCTSDLCEIIVLLNPSEATSSTTDIDVSWGYSNVTQNLTINWSENNGLSTTVKAVVTKLYSDQFIVRFCVTLE